VATWSALSADYTARFDADKPLILPSGLNRVVDAQWVITGDLTDTGNFDSDAFFPERCAYDHQTQGVTKSSASRVDNYLVLTLDGEDFDSVVMLNQVGDTDNEIRIEIADDDAFTINVRQLATVSPSSWNEGGRYAFLDLRHTGSVPLRYSGVLYMRIYVKRNSASGTRDTLGGFGEVIVGQRIMAPYEPTLPFDANSQITTIEEHIAWSGLRWRYARHSPALKLNARWVLDDATDIAEWVELWEKGLQGGLRPFVYIPYPSSAPQSAHWMLTDSLDIESVHRGYAARDFVINATEHGWRMVSDD
jgi:hypothetical protein